jgi:hypothetical protein
LATIGIDYTTIYEVARFGGALGIITVASDSARSLWTRREVTIQDLNPSLGVAYAQYQVPRISISKSALVKLLKGTSHVVGNSAVDRFDDCAAIGRSLAQAGA